MNSYQSACELTSSLFKFPYQAPCDVSTAVKLDDELMEIIKSNYAVTVDNQGRRQTDLSAADRIRFQNVFKLKIYAFLEKCLEQEPLFAPAYLLYPRVAEFNSRAPDRERLISIYERFLPMVGAITEGNLCYRYIQADIKNLGGNYFEKVERHLADFYCSLAILYNKVNKTKEAKAIFKKAVVMCPQVYGRGENKIYPF